MNAATCLFASAYFLLLLAHMIERRANAGQWAGVGCAFFTALSVAVLSISAFS